MPGLRPSPRLLRQAQTAQSIASNCRKVMCIGRNYADHIKELNNQRPSSPFFFLKPPSSLLPPNAGPIVRPRGIDMHHEVELGLVIGSRLRDLHPDDEQGAMKAIASYILAIDMTARNLQTVNKTKGLPWSTAKGFDTFCPISNPIALDRLGHPNPYNTHLKLSVTSAAGTKVRQSDKAELMLFRIPRILSEISRVMTLDEGDIILTGTPKGVGPLVGGDRVDIGCEVDGKEIEEASCGWDVVDGQGLYEFKE